jgi:hypothetical protein
MNPEEKADPSLTGPLRTESSPSSFRLLLIPFLLYLVWVLETYLLEGSAGLYLHFQPRLFFLYTLFANIIVGIFVPVMCLRSALRSGATNMFQIGFHSLRRTLPASALAALAGALYLVMFTPPGTRMIALLSLFLFTLPAAVAGVMICWVLIGTHLQAYIRQGTTAGSIIFGVGVTALLFGLSSAAHSPPLNQPETVLTFCVVGAAAALFFFAVRDAYASVIIVACASVPVMLQKVDPVLAAEFVPSVYGVAALSLACLIGCHLYLFKNFRTVRIPA